MQLNVPMPNRNVVGAVLVTGALAFGVDSVRTFEHGLTRSADVSVIGCYAAKQAMSPHSEEHATVHLTQQAEDRDLKAAEDCADNAQGPEVDGLALSVGGSLIAGGLLSLSIRALWRRFRPRKDNGGEDGPAEEPQVAPGTGTHITIHPPHPSLPSE